MNTNVAINSTTNSTTKEEVAMNAKSKYTALYRAVNGRNSGEIVAAVSASHHSSVISAYKKAPWAWAVIADAFASQGHDAPSYVLARVVEETVATNKVIELDANDTVVEAAESVKSKLPELFEVTKAALSAYKREIAKAPVNVALGAASNAARQHHQAFGILGEAVYAVARKEGDPAAIMRDAWKDMETSARICAEGYYHAILLTRSQNAQRRARPMDLHAIELRVGESGTHKAFSSLEELRISLREEPDVVEMLAKTGRARRTARVVHQAWKAMPRWLRDEIVANATSTRFATAEQKAKVNGKVVKGRAYQQLEALETGVCKSVAVQGASLAVRTLLKLALQYADRAEWWAAVQEPRKPSLEMWNEEIYDGEETKVWESPLRKFVLGGRTLGDQWLQKCEFYTAMVDDYAEAAEIAEQALDNLAALLEIEGYEVIYAFVPVNTTELTATGQAKVVTTFDQITDKDEAVERLYAAQADRNLKRLSGGSNWFEAPASSLMGHDELKEVFTAEQLKALEAL